MTMIGTPSIIFVLGRKLPTKKYTRLNRASGPLASGKGTLCKRLAEEHNLYHLSVGGNLRYLINGPLADQADIVEAVRSSSTKGLVRGDVIAWLLMDKIKEEMSTGKATFVLDGFPRNLEQDEAFKEMMKGTFDVRSTPFAEHSRLVLR